MRTICQMKLKKAGTMLLQGSATEMPFTFSAFLIKSVRIFFKSPIMYLMVSPENNFQKDSASFHLGFEFLLYFESPI